VYIVAGELVSGWVIRGFRGAEGKGTWNKGHALFDSSYF
jgi:hypothetical protein